MRQIKKVDGMYHIFNCETLLVEVMDHQWQNIAAYLHDNPDIYAIDSSVK